MYKYSTFFLLVIVFYVVAISADSSPSPALASSTSSSASASSSTTATLSSTRVARTADFEDYRAAQNLAVQIFLTMDTNVAHYVNTNTTLLQQYLVGNYSKLFVSNAEAAILFPGAPAATASSPPGPTGIANLVYAVSVSQNLGEIHTFGAFQTQQLTPSDPRFCPQSTGCEAYSNAALPVTAGGSLLVDTSPVTIFIRSIGSSIVRLTTGPGYVEYRSEYLFTVRVRNCPQTAAQLLDGITRKNAQGVSVQLNVLATVTLPSDYPVNFAPIAFANAYTPCA